MTRYEVRDTDDALEALTLVDRERDASVTVAPARGGMVTRFSIAGETALYLDEATLRDPTRNVRGGVPLLMPIAGKLADDRYALGDRAFTLKQHGFARNLPWSVSSRSVADGASVTLRLTDTPETRAQFPFGFVFEAEYTLRDGALSITLRATCTDGGPMPMHVGTHPYFFVPRDAKAQATVTADATRAWDNTAKREVAFTGFPSLGEGEVDLHLLDQRATRTVLRRPGLRDLHIAWSAELPVLVVWTLPDKDFVCVEPWSAPANALNEGRARTVSEGDTASWSLSISAPR